MSLRNHNLPSNQISVARRGCFAVDRNDMQVNVMRELQSAGGDASQVAPAVWADADAVRAG